MGADAAISRFVEVREHPIHVATYEELGKSAFGFTPFGIVKDGFEAAVRQHPSCHAPLHDKRVIIGDFPDPQDSRFLTAMAEYTKLLSISLNMLWPAQDDYSAMATQDTTTKWLRDAHKTNDNDTFSLPHLPKVYERFANKQEPRFATLAPHHPGPYIINFGRFDSEWSNAYARKIPLGQRQALVEQAVANLSAEYSSVMPQELIKEVAQVRGESVRRGQAGPFIACALALRDVTLKETNDGVYISFDDATAIPERPGALEEKIRVSNIGIQRRRPRW